MSVDYECTDHIATITLSRPDALNALNLETWAAFGEATRRLEDDADAWVGIVTGTGRAFCAGADVGETIVRLMDDPNKQPYSEPQTIMRGQVITKPLIAAVNGLALGGGLEVALACDIRIAATGARFGAPEVTLGLIPGWGGTQRLPRHIPWAVAAKMILTGEMISAEEARACGLVSAVIDPEELMTEARKIAEVMCSRGPLALRAAKEAMNESLERPLSEGLERERELFLSMAYTDDLREGIAAFKEKRKPSFQGR